MIGDVKAKASITGEVAVRATIEGSAVGKVGIIYGELEAQTILGDISVGKVIVEHPEYPNYKGDYEVVPGPDAQSLETANKTMKDDVRIKAIPYYDVSNPYGRTIYIGGDLNA